MEETIGKASLRDATIGTGVAVDKIQALTDQKPGLNVNIVNIPMPTEEERAEMRAIDSKLDAFVRQYGRKQLAGPVEPRLSG